MHLPTPTEDLLGWMVFAIGAFVGVVGWEGTWGNVGAFLSDLAGASVSAVAGGGFLFLILQAFRD